jgi:proteic killer suppression protein
MPIASFKCSDTQAFFETGTSRVFTNVRAPLRRKLTLLNDATSLADLRALPGNHLEALADDRAGQHSIRVNDQYRLCFVWTADGPLNVECVDYH